MHLPLSLINLVNWKYPFYEWDPIWRYILLLCCRHRWLSPIGRLPSGVAIQCLMNKLWYSIHFIFPHWGSINSSLMRRSDCFSWILLFNSSPMWWNRCFSWDRWYEYRSNHFPLSCAGLVSFNAPLCCRQSFIMCRTSVLKALLRCRLGQVSIFGRQPWDRRYEIPVFFFFSFSLMEVFLTAVQRDKAVASADINIELICSIAHPIESQFVLSDWKLSRLVKYYHEHFCPCWRHVWQREIRDPAVGCIPFGELALREALANFLAAEPDGYYPWRKKHRKTELKFQALTVKAKPWLCKTQLQLWWRFVESHERPTRWPCVHKTKPVSCLYWWWFSSNNIFLSSTRRWLSSLCGRVNTSMAAARRPRQQECQPVLQRSAQTAWVSPTWVWILPEHTTAAWASRAIHSCVGWKVRLRNHVLLLWRRRTIHRKNDCNLSRTRVWDPARATFGCSRRVRAPRVKSKRKSPSPVSNMRPS